MVVGFWLLGFNPGYAEVIDLGTLGGPERNGVAFALNDREDAAGYTDKSDGIVHAFLYSNGVMTDLGTFGGGWSMARAINSEGVIVGNADNPEGYYRAFLYKNGVMADLGSLGGNTSVATAINDRGQVAGFGARFGEVDFFFLSENGRMTDLDIWCTAYGINKLGQISGETVIQGYHHPIIYTPGLPPVANAGADQAVECSGPEGTVVTLDGSGSSDPDGDPLTFTWTGPFGTATGIKPTVTLPTGVHAIQLTVSDGKGGSSTESVTITVKDKTAPEILALSAHPDRLWPPKHQMVPVHVQVSFEDSCDPQPSCRITSVSSNQPETGRGAGTKGNDWEITDDLTVMLRAERSGKEGDRIYTLTVACTDQNGNHKGYCA